MPSPIPNPNRRKVILWRSVIGGLLILGGIIWAAQNSGKAAACVMDSKTILAKPPNVSHRYDSESIAYYKNDSRYTPVNDSGSVKKDGKTYELHLAVDDKSINPVFGSTISGEIWVTENGRKLSRLPLDSAGTPLIESEVPVSIVGLNTIARAPQLLERGGASVTQIPTTKQRLPYPTTHLITDMATDKDMVSLAKGRAEFTLVYFGHRELPYIELLTGLSRPTDKRITTDVWFASKAVCFSDQSTTDIKQPDIDHVQKGEFYYDITLTPDKVAGNQTKRIRVDITSRNSSNKRIQESPYQRVSLWSYPVNNVAWGETAPGQVEAGSFVVMGTDTKLDSELANSQTIGIKVPTKNRLAKGVELDLINGKGRAYFDYSGNFGDTGAPSQFAFIVQPTNYYDLDILQNRNSAGAASYRMKQQIKYPDQRQGTEFLYISWRETEALINEIFTVKSIPIILPRS